MDYAEAFGVVVQERRMSLELRQDELAKLVGVQRNLIGLLERGTLPALDTYKTRVADALSCPLKHLEDAAARVFEDSQQGN